MKSIDEKELKSLQLDIMQYVHDFCEANNLKYFLAYGSLLGAVRHGGYIPWDDDIDIVMPRQDYEKFRESFNISSGNYKFIDYLNTPTYSIPFGKVHDTRTHINEGMYKEDCFGVYIDVFPLDGVVDERRIIKNQWFVKFLNAKKSVIDNQRTFFKNIIMIMGKLVLLPFSTWDIISWIDKSNKSVSYSEASKVACTCDGVREILDKSIFDKSIKHKFEDREFYIPVDYDKYLSSLYGDYMQLPPVEKRITHHTFEAWWK